MDSERRAKLVYRSVTVPTSRPHFPVGFSTQYEEILTERALKLVTVQMNLVEKVKWVDSTTVLNKGQPIHPTSSHCVCETFNNGLPCRHMFA